jgi:predicted outer membrane repeat protein
VYGYEDMARHDIPTAAAIGFTISVLSTFGHEVLGHGGACVLTGCDPVQFSSTYFIGNKAGLSGGAIRTISLGGTLFNLVLGVAFLALLRTRGPGAPARRYYVLWFGAMLNLVSASGYILFGSAFAFGDYKTILDGAALPLRIGCILLGGVLYLGSLWVAARNSDPLLGSGPDRRSRLFALVLLPAMLSSTTLSASALLSPVPEAALFSFIGHLFPAFGAWGMLQWFVGDGRGEPARNIARSRAWWIAAALVVLAVVAVGPGVPRATRAELESRTGE